MPGNCAIYRSWDTGNLLTASDLTTSFTVVGVTNMTPTCMDDYALDTNQFRSTSDPYPGSVASLPTSLAGELERIRYVIKKLTGWSQWYANTEDLISPQGPNGAGLQTFTVAQTNNGTYNDNYVVRGFNTAAYKPPLGGGDTASPSFVVGMEDKFWNTELGKNTYEWYVNYQSQDHVTVQNFRPFFAAVARDLNADHRALVIMDAGDSGGKIRFQAAASTVIAEFDSAKALFTAPVGIALAGSTPVGIGASLAVKPGSIGSQGITVRGLSGQTAAIMRVEDDGANQKWAVGPLGVQVGAPTGGDKGTGTVNATGYYINGSLIASLLSGYIFGLQMANNAGDATNDIDITAGECTSDDTTAANRVLIAPGALTKQLDAAWVVGNNQGGRDTGAIANGTWHVWAIRRSDTGVSDILYSLSATAPTMPTNYDRKRRIGAILREAGAIVAFVQDGNDFRRKTIVRDYNTTNPGTSAVTVTLSIPVGVRLRALCRGTIVSNSATGSVALFSDLSLTDETPVQNGISTVPASPAGDGNYMNNTASEKPTPPNVRFMEWTNTSAQIRARISASDANISLAVYTLGWHDLRGQVA